VAEVVEVQVRDLGWDSGMDTESVAAKYEVSRAWVHRLVQRRRETGSIEPRRQTKFRARERRLTEKKRQSRGSAAAGGHAGATCLNPSRGVT